MFDRPHIEDIIRQIKGPYPYFQKRIRLGDLIEILNDVWDEDDF